MPACGKDSKVSPVSLRGRALVSKKLQIFNDFRRSSTVSLWFPVDSIYEFKGLTRGSLWVSEKTRQSKGYYILIFLSSYNNIRNQIK